MIIKLYNNSSSVKTLNKTLVLKTSINITIKDNFNISTPTILLSNSVNLTDVNYCYIESITRYYFINSVEKINNNLTKLTLSTDLLMTYKNNILNSYGVVKQTKNNANAYASDYKLLDTKQTKTINFENTNLFSSENKLYLTGVN